MKDKIILITGSTDGIGKQVALELLELDAHVILHGRNLEKMKRTLKELRKNTTAGKISTVMGDFSSFDSVKRMSDDLHMQFDRIDVLINNAGLFSWKREMTENGNETTFQVNHLAPFLLTSLLIDLVKKSEFARIVNVASGIHSDSINFDNLQGEQNFSRMDAYCRSKLCNILFTYKLADLLSESHVTANTLHPGYINSNINPNDSEGQPVTQGVISTIFLATSPSMKEVSGKYVSQHAKIVDSKAISYDKDAQNKLWEISEKLIGQKFM